MLLPAGDLGEADIGRYVRIPVAGWRPPLTGYLAAVSALPGAPVVLALVPRRHPSATPLSYLLSPTDDVEVFP